MAGISLKEAMHNKQEGIAVAMGYSDATSLRKNIQENLLQHFFEGDPGNVIISMSNERVALINYRMVGWLTRKER
jgi:hypothetical protein